MHSGREGGREGGRHGGREGGREGGKGKRVHKSEKEDTHTRSSTLQTDILLLAVAGFCC